MQATGPDADHAVPHAETKLRDHACRPRCTLARAWRGPATPRPLSRTCLRAPGGSGSPAAGPGWKPYRAAPIREPSDRATVVPCGCHDRRENHGLRTPGGVPRRDDGRRARVRHPRLRVDGRGLGIPRAGHIGPAQVLRCSAVRLPLPDRRRHTGRRQPVPGDLRAEQRPRAVRWRPADRPVDHRTWLGPGATVGRRRSRSTDDAAGLASGPAVGPASGRAAPRPDTAARDRARGRHRHGARRHRLPRRVDVRVVEAACRRHRHRRRHRSRRS